MNKTKRKKEWFDDDSFWRETYAFMFPESRFERTAEEMEQVLKLTRPRGRTVLDLCCGPGRCSIDLAARGFSVTGVDRTRFLLEKARARARSSGLKIKWVEQDMRDFEADDEFDLVLSMFTSFGYFEDRREDLTVLENMFTSLRSGGSCLIDVMGKERLAKILLATSSETLPDGSLLVQRHEVVDDWTRVQNEWILIRKSRAKRFKFRHSLYSGLELKERMESVGFGNVRLYGNLDGDAYGPDAVRLIAVGDKASSPSLNS